MPWGYAAAAVGTVVAGSMSADAAGSAADAQAQSSRDAIAEQRREYDQTRADQASYMANGNAGNNKLAYLLGLSTNPGGSSASAGNLVGANLVDTSSGVPKLNQALYASSPEYKQAWDQALAFHQKSFGTGYSADSDSSKINEYLTTLLQPTINKQQQEQAAAPGSDYGSLTKSFTAADLAADPVYNSGLQFGLNQGTGAINQRALQSGGYDSGATLKALTQYANDYGSTKANDAYNRFNTNQSNIYNRFAGISGTGQQATNQVQAAGTNMANSVSNSLTDQGNARSAGIIGGSNAWGNAVGGLNNIYNNYNSNQNLQKLLGQQNYGGIDYGSGYSGSSGGLDYGYGGA